MLSATSRHACAAVTQAEAAATQGLATAGSYGPGSMQRQMSLGLAGRRMSISSRSAPSNLQPSSPPGMGSSGNLADAQQAEHNGALKALSSQQLPHDASSVGHTRLKALVSTTL